MAMPRISPERTAIIKSVSRPAPLPARPATVYRGGPAVFNRPSMSVTPAPKPPTSTEWIPPDGYPCGSRSDPKSRIFMGGKCVPNLNRPPTMSIMPVKMEPMKFAPSGPVLPPTTPRPTYSITPTRPEEKMTITPIIEQRATTPPSAASSTQSIIAASSGGEILPTIEEKVVDQIVTGGESIAKPKGGGGTMLVAAGAGFLVAGPIGAIVAAIVGNAITKPKTHAVAGFDGFSLKRAFRKAKSAVSSVTKPFDVTSSKSLTGRIPVVGKYITRVSRAGVATSAAAMTGGMSVLAGQRGWLPRSTFGLRPTAEGAVIGAAAGAAIVAVPYVASALATTSLTSGLAATSTAIGVAKGLKGGGAETSEEGLAAIEAQMAAEAQAAAGQPPGAAGPSGGAPKSGLGLAAAGAGGGFVVAGPPGAILGGLVGYLLGRK